MKQLICKTCGETGLDFSPSQWDGRKPECRPCLKEYSRKKWEEKTQTTKLYYLPEEHYVGVANNLERRLRLHKQVGKIIEGWEILAHFERHVDAAFFEIQFHQRGYNGYTYEKVL